jgi:hypothetical protein
MIHLSIDYTVKHQITLSYVPLGALFGLIFVPIILTNYSFVPNAAYLSVIVLHIKASNVLTQVKAVSIYRVTLSLMRLFFPSLLFIQMLALAFVLSFQFYPTSSLIHP